MASGNRPSLPEALIAAMKAKGLSVNKTAELSGLEQSNLRKIIAGKVARPHLDTLKELARVLDAPWLVDYAALPTPARSLGERVALLEQRFEARDTALAQVLQQLAELREALDDLLERQDGSSPVRR